MSNSRRRRKQPRPTYARSGEQLADWLALTEAERIAVICMYGLQHEAVPVQEREAYADVVPGPDDCCPVCTARKYGGPEAAAVVMLSRGGEWEPV